MTALKVTVPAGAPGWEMLNRLFLKVTVTVVASVRAEDAAAAALASCKANPAVSSAIATATRGRSRAWRLG